MWLVLRSLLLATGAELGEARTLEIDGRQVTVLFFRGAEPAPTLLVATHGGLSSKESVLAVCWAARRRGADCVAVDALGHGGSSAQPDVFTVRLMREAMRVAPGLGHYENVRFLGHSMGAYLGRGTPYPCGESVALGQTTDCDDDRVVWGTLHRTLGLSEDWYLLSHVLESWTPWVVERALDLVLPKAPAPSSISLQIALMWLSFAVAVAAGVAFARAFRAAATWPPALRGLGGAVIVWTALDVGAWRNLWFLTPTQASDFVVLGLVLAGSLVLALLMRLFGGRSPLVGAWLGTLFPFGAALALFVTFRSREMGGLMALLPLMSIPLIPWVWLWERASRAPRGELVESCVFVAALLTAFVTLLLPAF